MLAEAFLVSDPGSAPVRADDALSEADPAPRVQTLGAEGLVSTHRALLEIVTVRIVLGVVFVGVLGGLCTALGFFITDKF